MNEQCILCNPKKDALILRCTDGVVLLDDPVRAGHVLVGARTHAPSLHDLSAEDAAAVMRLANRVAQTIVTETGAEKVYVAAIGDKDKHFHVHLIPKMKEDPKLGPYIFGTAGWICFLPSSIDAEQQSRLLSTIQTALPT